MFYKNVLLLKLDLIFTLKKNIFVEYIHIPKNLRFKNISSSTSHKKNSVFTSLRDFKKILSYTFIYESILMKIYMNTNI